MSLLSRVFGRRYSPTHRCCESCARLGQLRQARDVTGLIEFLGAARDHKTETAAALAWVTGQAFGTVTADWKSWWRKQKTLAAG